MEELQSTEILDREILEDARKKAHRILKTADETVNAQTQEWEKKTSAGLDEIKQKYSRQTENAVREITARLPVEKRRIKAQIVDTLIVQAVENWYAHLERARALAILAKGLKRRLDESGEAHVTETETQGEPVRAFFWKITSGEAENMLSELLPGRKFSLEESNSGGAFPEIVIETGTARIISSIGKDVDFFVHRNRTELAEALLGREFFDDQGAQPC